MIGTLRLAVAVCFAIALSQFPAFSDQYVQRLGGQVDALARMAAEFDAAAQAAGLTRDEALVDLSGSVFRDAHQASMRDLFTRLDRARTDLQMLRLAGPLERMLLPHRLRDPETLGATWGDFRPAVPVTVAGLWATAIGLALGWLLTALPALVTPRRRVRPGWR